MEANGRKGINRERGEKGLRIMQEDVHEPGLRNVVIGEFEGFEGFDVGSSEVELGGRNWRSTSPLMWSSRTF